MVETHIDTTISFESLVNQMNADVVYMLSPESKYKSATIKAVSLYDSDSKQKYYTWLLENNYKYTLEADYVYPRTEYGKIIFFQTLEESKENLLKFYFQENEVLLR